MRRIIVLFFLIVSLPACRKAEEIPSAGSKTPLQEEREIGLSVMNKEWNAKGEEGMFSIPSCLENAEYDLGVYYRNWKNRKIYGASYSSEAIIPEREEALSYKLAIPADCAEFSYEWYAVSPYSSTTVTASASKDLTLSVFPVQQPSGEAIDPRFNFVVSKPFQAGEKQAEAEAFKRMVAILNLNVTGLEPSEKIHAVTINIAQSISKTNVLAGLSDITLSSDFDQSGKRTIANPSNSATAIFPEGLEGGSIFYAVNPMTINAGSALKVNVTTTDSTYIRTVKLDSELVLGCGEKTALDFNIKGEEYVSSATVFQAVKPVAGAFDIPSISGKNVSGVTLYSDVCSAFAEDRTIQILDGGDAVSSSATGNDGTVVFDINTLGGTSLSGMKIKAAAEGVRFAAALIYTETKPVDMNDYLDMFNAGLDIKIGDQIVNKESCGAKYVCVKPSELSTDELKTALEKNGVLFLDNSDDASNTFTLATNATLTYGANKVVIGRYRNMPQPVIEHNLPAKATKYFYVSGNTRFLNVSFKSINTQYGAFVNTGAGTTLDLSVSCQDCSFYTNFLGMFRYGAATANGFKEIVVDNCIIRVAGNMFNASSAGLPTTAITEKIKVTNCAITTSEGTTKGNFSIVNLTGDMPALELTFTGNTVYGFTNSNGLLYVKSAKSITVENNIFWDELTADRTIVKVTAASGFLTMNGNWANKFGEFLWTPGVTDKFTTYSPATTGSLDSTTEFFGAGKDAAKGYFPSLIEGAGCTYDTKYWTTK